MKSAQETTRLLSRRFERRLPARLVELHAAVLALEAGEPDAVGNLQTLGHSLHGSSGSLGHGDIGEMAARVEAAAREELLEATGELRAAVARAARECLGTAGRSLMLAGEPGPSADDLFVRAVEDLSFDVRLCPTALDVFAATEGNDGCVVVVRLDDENLDGRALTSRLCARPDFRGRVVVIGCSDCTIELECLSAGARHVLGADPPPELTLTAVVSALLSEDPR